nr:MAG TPA: hypothetical protein [Caudoviricetes sp.]
MTAPLFNEARRPRLASSLRAIVSKPVAPECRESLDGIGREYPTAVDFSRNIRGEPRL